MEQAAYLFCWIVLVPIGAFATFMAGRTALRLSGASRRVALAVVVITMGLLIAGTVVALFTPLPADAKPRKPSSQCVRALDAAEGINDDFDDLLAITTSIASRSTDITVIQKDTADIVTLTESVREHRRVFVIANAKCRAGK